MATDVEFQFLADPDGFPVGGWRSDLEDRKFLDSLGSFDAAWMKRRRERLGIPTPREIDPRNVLSLHRGDEYDPRDWLRVENQGPVGACQGFSLTSSVELAYNFEASSVVQLSPQYAYIMSQRKDGIRGDRGSTCTGGIRVAKEDGLPPEDVCPYPGRYSTEIPEAAHAAAKPYRINTSVRLRSYNDVFEFLASCIGGVHIGIPWGVPNSAVVESYRAAGGGHSVTLAGYSKRKDRDNRNYIWLINSWGRNWGNNGYAEIAPSVIEQMLRAGEMFGLSDMTEIEPRRIKHKFL